MRADRIVLPIPPGVHWSDEMPVIILPSDEPTNEKPQLPAKMKKVRLPLDAPTAHGPRQYGAPPSKPAPPPATENRKREKSPKPKADPKLVSAAASSRSMVGTSERQSCAAHVPTQVRGKSPCCGAAVARSATLAAADCSISVGSRGVPSSGFRTSSDGTPGDFGGPRHRTVLPARLSATNARPSVGCCLYTRLIQRKSAARCQSWASRSVSRAAQQRCRSSISLTTSIGSKSSESHEPP